MVAAHASAPAPRDLPVQRLLIALGASLLAHFLIAGGWTGGAGPHYPAVAVPPLQARLAPGPESANAPALDLPASATSAVLPVATPPLPPPPPRLRPARPATVVVTKPAGAAPRVTDMRFYLARELDQYPSPLTALDPGAGTQGSATGSVRLWVSIDQAGQVVDAAVIDADPPGVREQSARELVLATRFLPAHRGGRPVKSRVLLVLRYGT